MRLTTRRIDAPDLMAGVTMLELFFDLVFVYLVTQLTALIATSQGWVGYGHAALVLAVTWWMYDGYAWLANNVAPTTTATRLPMLLAMTCFLAMGVVVPEVFGPGAWIFAVAYLIVVTIHAIQFSRSSVGTSAAAIRSVLPTNYGVGALLVVAAAVGPRWAWICWSVAVVVLLVALSGLAGGTDRRFTLRIDHFAERHRLLVIIALGETIIATGVSAQDDATEPAVLSAMALAMMLIVGLWWVYFAVGDDEAALVTLESASPQRRTALASRGFSSTHLLHIAGLVLVAAALHEVVRHPGHPLEWGMASTLSAGAATFLLAQVGFRRVLSAGPVGVHLGAILASLAVLPVGVSTSGATQLLALGVVVTVAAGTLQRQVDVSSRDCRQPG